METIFALRLKSHLLYNLQLQNPPSPPTFISPPSISHLVPPPIAANSQFFTSRTFRFLSTSTHRVPTRSRKDVSSRSVSTKVRSDDCYFSITEVLAKHDEKYMPQEVAASIEKNKKKIEEGLEGANEAIA
ncbi:hypothetical protein F3Y22_tig00110280pilonHSYRG00028 [Hibiscus syriacus]|uniref:Uncharacterized protein n=1 Tax=Hibiscus syriacus TaxID=106335 RepID=A0A6A3B795_HIBSY|nr:hypothetical protein F3Y22_tig00110280pilonHSYRG00028 [Hibiscus syriacus]